MRILDNKISLWLKGVLHEKCPNCGKGQVFMKGKRPFAVPVMKQNCEACHYRFNREPGYFLGAMYISYGIAVLLGMLTFLLMRYFLPALPLIWTPLTIVAVILLAARKNYRVSRIVYMHIFPW
jgi:uncharacterized protein (DUF983 family)